MLKYDFELEIIFCLQDNCSVAWKSRCSEKLKIDAKL